MPHSSCCQAYTNMEELGICPECKEHCTFEEVCVACGGEGEIVSDEESVTCHVCNGSGMIEITEI